MTDGTDRAATTTLSYVLALAITVTLSGGLLLAAGGAIDERREATATDELRVVGQQLGARLAAADRLTEGGASTVRIRADAPGRIAGSTYTVELVGGSPAELRLNATRPAVSVSVTVPVRTNVSESSVAGGDVVVVLTDDGLEVRSA